MRSFERPLVEPARHRHAKGVDRASMGALGPGAGDEIRVWRRGLRPKAREEVVALKPIRPARRAWPRREVSRRSGLSCRPANHPSTCVLDLVARTAAQGEALARSAGGAAGGDRRRAGPLRRHGRGRGFRPRARLPRGTSPSPSRTRGAVRAVSPPYAYRTGPASHGQASVPLVRERVEAGSVAVVLDQLIRGRRTRASGASLRTEDSQPPVPFVPALIVRLTA